MLDLLHSAIAIYSRAEIPSFARSYLLGPFHLGPSLACFLIWGNLRTFGVVCLELSPTFSDLPSGDSEALQGNSSGENE